MAVHVVNRIWVPRQLWRSFQQYGWEEDVPNQRNLPCQSHGAMIESPSYCSFLKKSKTKPNYTKRQNFARKRSKRRTVKWVFCVCRRAGLWGKLKRKTDAWNWEHRYVFVIRNPENCKAVIVANFAVWKSPQPQVFTYTININ